jgi:hypothetical protein
MPLKRGVVYACSNRCWAAETICWAGCRRHMPDLARELYVTESLRAEPGDEVREPVTAVFPLSDLGHPPIRTGCDLKRPLRTGLDKTVSRVP